MVDANEKAPAPQANPHGLMPIGAVASHNIAAAIGQPEHAGTIETAIRDEINAMSSHFTLALADIQTQFEVEQNKLKDAYDGQVAAIRADFSWVKAHSHFVGAVLILTFIVGFAVGHFV